MIEVFRHRKRFYIVFEYMEGTVLDELEKMPGGLGEERTRERIFQVCRAISYCHSNHVCTCKPLRKLNKINEIVLLIDNTSRHQT